MYLCRYMCMFLYMCVYVCICICMFVYVYLCDILFFFWHHQFHRLSWPPLLLDTSITRRKIWCPQPSTYPITHRHQKMQNYMKTEEVTLEPRLPLKRIYTPPSIKVLFPLNQCKSSFRKFTTNSIKTYTSQYNKNMKHNLFDHTLTEEEFSVLTKGLSFVPTPTKITNKKQINAGISSRNAC